MSHRGLWDCPTIINNVETFTNVPLIMDRSADWFLGIGTEDSPGTKVFSLMGKVCGTLKLQAYDGQCVWVTTSDGG